MEVMYGTGLSLGLSVGQVRYRPSTCIQVRYSRVQSLDKTTWQTSRPPSPGQVRSTCMHAQGLACRFVWKTYNLPTRYLSDTWRIGIRAAVLGCGCMRVLHEGSE